MESFFHVSILVMFNQRFSLKNNQTDFNVLIFFVEAEVLVRSYIVSNNIYEDAFIT